jgi:ATP-dependent DNA helicase RecG
MGAIRTAAPPALDWDAPVTSLPGVGPKRADSLRNLGIFTIGDLLRHFPRTYIDRRASTPIADLEPGTTATVVAEIVEARARRFRRNASMCVATLSDGDGTLKATWFGRGFLASQMTPGKWLLLTGDVVRHGGIALRNPDYRLYESRPEAEAQLGSLEPVYPLTDGVSQRVLRTWMRTALERAAPPNDVVPETVRTKRGLLSAAASVSAAHFPTNAVEAERALEAGAYAEALALQTAVLQARREQPNAGIRHQTNGPLLRALPDRLTYGLTRAQRRCVTEVFRDMAADRPMARMLQGDVGAGKTCVALHAAAAALDGDYQVAVMAPTEVLAYQHHATFADAFVPLNIECALLTGTSKDAQVTRKNTARGIARVVVGTHALFQDATQFAQLGLVIVDEQHRFGVNQRDRLIKKGASPDVLHMTATPLPRSLALTLYGRMDLSIIDHLPPGRLPVKTRIVPPDRESGLWEFLRNEAERGAQAYVVCPMLEDTEKNGARVRRADAPQLGGRPPARYPARIVARAHGFACQAKRRRGFSKRPNSRTRQHHGHRGRRGREVSQYDGGRRRASIWPHAVASITRARRSGCRTGVLLPARRSSKRRSPGKARSPVHDERRFRTRRSRPALPGAGRTTRRSAIRFFGIPSRRAPIQSLRRFSRPDTMPISY